MHMSDALISPAVGTAMWAVATGIAICSARKLKPEMAERKIPLMGVLGAFIFAAQMINFTIPVTGSSGHLGGGMILAVLLGPPAAFLVMFSILSVQALFFADGGLLALGCNVFNLGFWPCFIAYPFIFKKMVMGKPGRGRILAGSMIATVISLQLGAFGVVLQTLFSGISELPFGAFLFLMQPIHLAIGVVEGAVTAAMVSFIWRARPEIMEFGAAIKKPAAAAKPLLIVLAVAALVAGGVVSWFASSHPDGLEWAISKVSGREELPDSAGGVHSTLAGIQKKTAFLPDYQFKKTEGSESSGVAAPGNEKGTGETWPAVNAGTTFSGLAGGLMVLLLSGAIGLFLRFSRK